MSDTMSDTMKDVTVDPLSLSVSAVQHSITVKKCRVCGQMEISTHSALACM